MEKVYQNIFIIYISLIHEYGFIIQKKWEDNKETEYKKEMAVIVKQQRLDFLTH